jgi:hypothetical protein
VLLAFAALAGTGLLAGILIVVPRISPLAACSGPYPPSPWHEAGWPGQPGN